MRQSSAQIRHFFYARGEKKKSGNRRTSARRDFSFALWQPAPSTQWMSAKNEYRSIHATILFTIEGQGEAAAARSSTPESMAVIKSAKTREISTCCIMASRAQNKPLKRLGFDGRTEKNAFQVKRKKCTHNTKKKLVMDATRRDYARQKLVCRRQRFSEKKKK